MRSALPASSCLLFVLAIALALAGGCSAPVERTFVYDTRFGDETALDLYSPELAPGAARPTIVIVHGGAWKHGSRSDFRSVARVFARAGYVTASVDYRLGDAGRFPSAVQDVGCALAYLENHAEELGIDPARIALLGYSAGAHLSALVALDDGDPELAPDCVEGAPTKPAAVIDGAGPADLVTLDSPFVSDFLGGSNAQIPATYVLASPTSHVTADDPPFLLLHGDADQVVSESQSVELRDALRGVGVEANLLIFHGSGHVLNAVGDSGAVWKSILLDTPEVWIAIGDFLDRKIGRP